MNKKRNRQSGYINAFKQRIIDKGTTIVTREGRAYKWLRIGMKQGICVVRIN